MNLEQFAQNRPAHLAALADAFYQNLERETHCEYGGWGLDDKRPFGNSSVNWDILEICGIDYEEQGKLDEAGIIDEFHDYAGDLYDDLGAYLRAEWARFKTIKSHEATI